ncbi:hypothetical protein [Gluconobacter sp. P5B12]|uniref:hypothetical protein n=1 Tax=unclassified Gluconobacter TaxID=2644261 RepID=UPI001C049F37|nr:hypothetical protein [Gluconobacter sp. P5B12]
MSSELNKALNEVKIVRDFLKRADVRSALAGLNTDELFGATYSASRAAIRLSHEIKARSLEAA